MRDVRTAEWVSLLLGRIRTEKIIAIDVRLPTEFILDEYSGAAGIAAVHLAAPLAVWGTLLRCRCAMHLGDSPQGIHRRWDGSTLAAGCRAFVLSTSAGDSDSAGLAESAPTKEAIPRACTSPAGASGRADGGRSANAGWRWRCGGEGSAGLGKRSGAEEARPAGRGHSPCTSGPRSIGRQGRQAKLT